MQKVLFGALFFVLVIEAKASLRTLIVNKGIEFANKFEDKPALESGEDELTVDLKNPKLKDGILITTEGGVIQNSDIRIQAKKISYTKRFDEHKIVASQDLLVQYRGRVYVGDSFSFDFRKKEGVITNGKTFVAPFYIGGDEIVLLKNGEYKVENAFLTTCENIESSWEIHANKVNVKKNELFEAKNIRFRVLNIPFWLPSFKLNLKKFFEPIVQYKLTWDKGAGPRATIRYQLYSWKDFALFLRGEYRLRKGFGGALETEYFPEHKRSSLTTRSYLASDVLPTDPEKKRRYRLQGEGHSISPSGKTKMDIRWDKYTDVLMPGDFKTTDFAINSALKTEFYLHHKEEEMIALVNVRPRVNSFQSMKQELPTGYVTMHAFRFPKIGIISDNWTKAAYQKLSYSDDLRISLPDFSSARLETQHDIYRPLHLGSLTLTPRLGVLGIYYNDSPQNAPITFALIKYGGKASFDMHRCFKKNKHMVQTYADYIGYSKPTSFVDDHYIFSIQDGYNQINRLRIGVKNTLLRLGKSQSSPTLMADIFANAFFFERKFPQIIPKIYLTFEWNAPSIQFRFWGAYNAQHKEVDFSNGRIQWTINQDAALSLEMRYRSQYDWRKADHENFVLDVTRSQKELLLSPISDQRMTILTHMFFRLTPFWSVHIQSHHGFLRKKEPPYNEIRADFFTLLTCNWRMRLTYMHTQKDDRVSVGFDLLKK